MSKRKLFWLKVGIAITLILIGILTTKDSSSDVEYSFSPNDADLYLQQVIQTPQPERSDKYCLDVLWSRESGWETGRLNPSSHACGIPQALPCTKIYPNFYSMEIEWRDGKKYLKNPNEQIEIAWGLKYIERRYGNACVALEFHDLNNWY